MKFHGRDIDPISFWTEYVEFPQHTKEDGSEFSPLVYCPNPAHDNFRSPAFQVNLRNPLVHCFSRCGIEGTYEHAVSVIEGLYDKYEVEKAGKNRRERMIRLSKAHREARRIILRGSKPSRGARHIARPVKKSTAIAQLDLDYEHYLPQVALEYLEQRCISGNEIGMWEIGWDPDEKRIVFPARDLDGNLRFLIKRAVDPRAQPKYLYSGGSEKTSVLYGADMIGEFKHIVLTEGVLDAIKLHTFMQPAVAILGTGISDQQVRVIPKLRPKKIYLMFDKDPAGVRNIEIATQKLRSYPLHVCRYPVGKSDPAELSYEEVERSIKTAVPILIWRQKLRKIRFE